MKRLPVILLFALFFHSAVLAQQDSSVIRQHYARPKPFSFLTHAPGDVWSVTKSPFEKNGWKGFLGVGVATAVLIHFDQPLLDGAMNIGRQLHIQAQTDYKVLINIPAGKDGIKIFKVPRNLNSALYTLGEGWVGVAIGGGFWIQGKLAHNNRSLQTASDLMEGFVSAAIFTQVVKRVTGRQSPFLRTQPGGKWTFFPSFRDFQVNTSNYDAFPSGHLATMMTTVTILAENYPEHKWIKPVGYLLIGLTGFAIMNTEVHWAGDYPLALASGYLNGKIITGRHKAARQHHAVF